MAQSSPHTPPLLRSLDLGVLGESWIELTNNLIQSCPDRVTPPLPFSSGEEYLRLLKEAQKESNPSSLISSRRDSPKVGSPKSPPNSPNPYYNTDEEELKGVFINYYGAKYEKGDDKDWTWQWSSRPDQMPPKDWKFEHPEHNSNISTPVAIRLKEKGGNPMNYSVRLVRVGEKSLFSKDVLYSLLLTNVLSMFIGAGIAVWLSKRGFLFARYSIE